MREAASALVAAQAIGVLIEDAEPAVSVLIANIHGPSMHQRSRDTSRLAEPQRLRLTGQALPGRTAYSSSTMPLRS